jgi:hypothetical protein
MAFDQPTRNRLQKFVSDARDLLTKEFRRQLQAEYGMDPTTGGVSSLDVLTYLDDNRRETARLLRETLEHYLAGDPSNNVMECLDRIVREQAFTVLNRLCALRMAEARGILIESIGNGYQSRGFQLYARLAGPALGETGDAYRCYLFSIFDEFALDLAVLFDRFSPQDRLFPRESVLLELLSMINHPDIAPLWAEDETIGWIYQYFNSPEERRQMRADSQAPRTSRELAVRNQFFTPRYVVEFLTDNTLGRTWYEMTRGNTVLKDQCHYLVRYPNEIFLAEGKESPQQNELADNLSREELLKQPVYIPFRRLKDPREILMLDPACGSMHFGLYAFDLFEKIYEEAWELEGQPDTGVFTRNGELRSLRETYESKEALMRDVPRLIIEHNIHGIDIDPRAVQIAGLSLWLRAQRNWQAQGIKPHDRPQILKSNVVCAEPMPGEKEMLQEFTESLKPRVFGQLVEIIFDKMQLAGEAGSLLKIEEEIETAIAMARKDFKEELLNRRGAESALFPELLPPRQMSLFDFTDMPDETQFWHDAEQKILDALREYAEQADSMHANRKRLFVRDAARGFAFIDICRKRYDVVLMNPPFGDLPITMQLYSEINYANSKVDIFASFVQRAIGTLCTNGTLGAITNRTGFFITHLEEWRRGLISGSPCPLLVADLGSGVLDNAMVETTAYIIGTKISNIITVIDCRKNDDRRMVLRSSVTALHNKNNDSIFFIPSRWVLSLPKATLAYWFDTKIFEWYSELNSAEPLALQARMGLRTLDDFRFLRAWWEVSALDNTWLPHSKGGEYSRFFSDIHLRINWRENGAELKALAVKKYSSVSRTIQAQDYYYRRGLTYSQRTTSRLSVRQMVPGGNFSAKGPLIVSTREPELEWLYYLLGFLNSDLVEYLLGVGISASDNAARSYDVGLFQRLPFKEPDQGAFSIIVELTKKAVHLARKKCSWSETEQSFIGHDLYDWCQIPNHIYDYVQEVESLRLQINSVVYDLYKAPAVVVDEINHYFADAGAPVKLPNVVDLTNTIFSYLLGSSLGRWDIRYVTGEKEPPELPDPFDPLPVCPLAMLQNAIRQPTKPEEVPDDYPIRISWSGILVDNEGHPEDIVGRIREAIEVIWRDSAGDIEQKACEILGVSSLWDYFSKPGNFFADHMKRYSKSRRQAPIYWPISTASGSYTLWLYYHRLTDQTLYTCVNDFVEPKMKVVFESASRLRQKPHRSSAEEKELERLSDLELELKDFRDELLRIAAFWKPNLNDGVQITAAPLWKLFRYTPWQRALKETWQTLERGDYDWAQLAYSIWPKRVREKCKKDKSLAIAHDLEELYEEQVAEPKKKGGGRRVKAQ